jgi:uncharacterized membrane protein
MAIAKNVGGGDRVARIAAGSALVALGLARRGWGRLALLAGAELLYTAYSQHCPLNQALGVNTLETAEPRLASQEPVQESSEESFPASDAPAWTMGNPS